MFFPWRLHLRLCFPRSHALFIRPASMKFGEFCFKTRSHDTIHIFKNYFITIFSAISFQFSIISGIQTDLRCAFGLGWKIKIILLFSLFLLIFMGLTTLLALFIGPTILFQLTFTFIYNTFSNKFSVSAK